MRILRPERGLEARRAAESGPLHAQLARPVKVELGSTGFSVASFPPVAVSAAAGPFTVRAIMKP